MDGKRNEEANEQRKLREIISAAERSRLHGEEGYSLEESKARLEAVFKQIQAVQ